MGNETAFSQPKSSETTLVANCNKCGTEVYKEVILEELGIPYKRVTYGNFSQTTDADGIPNGPITPFCDCEK